MKKVLVRGGMSPFDVFSVSNIILNNRIGTNVGNLVYLHGIYRMLMTDGCQVDVDHYDIERSRCKKEDIDRINAEYDMYIIPLADAFREEFIGYLKAFTKVIRKLRIPVVVVGVGMRIALDDTPKAGNPMDYAVKDFVKAVLEKSGYIGVRGEVTGTYLKCLGFKEEKDFTIIGCPSLYFRGNNLNLKEFDGVTNDSRIIVNASLLSGEKVNSFLAGILNEYKNSVFIPQLIREMRELYLGAVYLRRVTAYPAKIRNPIFKEGRARFFTNVPSWFEFSSGYDLSIGARMHGNIASINAGIPAVFITKDGRMKELIDYHNLPHLTETDLEDGKDLSEILQGINLYSINDSHEKNFRHYVDFLQANGVSNIYQGYQSPDETEFDRRIKEMEFRGPVLPFTFVDEDEKINRLEEYFLEEEEYIKELKREISIKHRYENHLPAFFTSYFQD